MRAKVFSEFIGTLFLLAIIVGSGIMGEQLSQGNTAVALLANSLATGAGLFVLIECLGPISGAHFNPVVSLVEFAGGRLRRDELLSYSVAQIGGAVSGMAVAHAMFGLDLLQLSSKARLGVNFFFSEFVATVSLLLVIGFAARKKAGYVSVLVAAYIVTAYWFTSSTSFANPAVTLARMFTDTFSGVSPRSGFYFLLAQMAGALFVVLAEKKSHAS